MIEGVENGNNGFTEVEEEMKRRITRLKNLAHNTMNWKVSIYSFTINMWLKDWKLLLERKS